MNSLRERLLRSSLAWKASGLTWRTGTIATRGRPLTPEAYLAQSGKQMIQLREWMFSGASVLEFGCGLGGNLVAAAPTLKAGIGIDVNRGYLRLARGLARKFGANNLYFTVPDDRLQFPPGGLDFVFSIGMFERIAKSASPPILGQMRDSLQVGGKAAIYFLSERFLTTDFANRLGAKAYVPWSRGEIMSELATAGLRVIEIRKWAPLEPDAPSVADLAVAVKMDA
jgi:SAM-dependent methyltransferase